MKIRIRHTFYLCFTGAFCCCLSPALAQATDAEVTYFDFNNNGSIDMGEELRIFDTNENGLIDIGEEQRRLVLRIVNPNFNELDFNNNGSIEESEISRAFEDDSLMIGDAKMSNQLKDTYSDLNQVRRINDGQLTVAAAEGFRRRGLPTTAQIENGLGGFRVRRSLEDATIIDNITDFERADAATISFSRDFEESNSNTAIRAALFRPFRTETGKAPNDGLTLTAYEVTPGIAVDRVNDSNSDDDDEDILSFAVNTDFEVLGWDLIPSQYFRANLIYETDVGFDSSVIGSTFQWEPIRSDIGLGAAVPVLGGAFDLRWRAIVEAQVASVLNDGDLEDVEDGDFLFRAGPKLQVEISPNTNLTLFDRLNLQAEYSFLQGISDDSETVNLLDTTLSFGLDETSNTNLELNYRIGETNLTGQDVEELTFGLSLKY